MSKLTLNDVEILGEGAQIKKAILQRYKNIKDFYKSNKISIAYNTFRSYFYQDVITAPTFKCIITRILDVDYNTLFVPIQQQIKNHVQSIYDNIKQYAQETDLETFDYLVEQCKSEKMNTELAMMYRAKARNYYYTNWIDRCTEYYDYAVEATSRDEINKRIYFLCELANDLIKENILDKADKKYKQLEDMVRLHKHRLDNNTLFYYHYWRGIAYMFYEKYDTAKEFFQIAVDYSPRNFEKAGAISSIGYAFKMLNKYSEAFECYHEALKYPDDEHVLTKAAIYNNIAYLYKDMKDYPNALIYVKKAIDISEKEDNLGKHIIYVSTRAEILTETGDKEAYRDFFNLLLSTKDKQMFKPDILNDIKSFIKYIDDISCLNELTRIIIELREASTSSGYTKGLVECVGLITIKIIKSTEGVYDEEAK